MYFGKQQETHHIERVEVPVGKIYEKDSTIANHNNVYRNFKTFEKESVMGNPSYVDTFENNFLVTHTTAVRLIAGDIDYTFNQQFQHEVYSASFRPMDGNLFVVGLETGEYQLYNANLASVKSKVALRQHMLQPNSPVQMIRFVDSSHCIAATNDRQLYQCHLIQGNVLQQFDSKHNDFIKCGVRYYQTEAERLVKKQSELEQQLFLTGSYDQTIHLWDLRTNCKKGPVIQFKHTDPVEDISQGIHDNQFYSCGGEYLICHDLRNGEAVWKDRCHQQTITSVSVSQEHKRIMTTSLDQQVKIHRSKNDGAATPEYVQHYTMPAQVLCGSISADERIMLVGLSSSCILRSRRSDLVVPTMKARHTELTTTNYRNMVDSMLMEQMLVIQDAIYLPRKRSYNLEMFHGHLSRFQYKDALVLALDKYSTDPIVVISLFEELRVRNELMNALDAKNDVQLKPLLEFLITFVRDPKYARVLIQVTKVVLQMYSPIIGQSPMIDRLFVSLGKQLEEELTLQRQLQSLTGMIDLLMIHSAVQPSKEQ